MAPEEEAKITSRTPLGQDGVFPAFLVFVGTALSLVINPGACPAVSLQPAAYIKANNGQRCGAVTACVDGWALHGSHGTKVGGS